MLEIKNKKIFAIVTIMVTIAIIYWCYNFYADGIYRGNTTTSGLAMYYTINSFGNFLPFYIFLGFLSSNWITDHFYKNKYSGFQKFVIARSNPKKRMKYEIWKVLFSSFIFRIVLHILVLLIINTFFVKLEFDFVGDPSYFPDGFFALASNSVLSLLFFIIYSSIGFSIFSLFLYSLIYFIKNYYVYKVGGVIMLIFGVLLPAFLGNIYLSHSSDYSYFVTGLLYSIYSGGLMSPGLEVLNQYPPTYVLHIYFFISCLGYIIISIILILIRYVREKKYG